MIPTFQVGGFGRTMAAISVGGSFATWSTTDKAAGISLSNGNRTAARVSGSNTYNSVRANRAIASKAYWEITTSGFGGAGVRAGIGIALAGLSLDTSTAYPGSTADSTALWIPNNTVYLNGTPTDYTNVSGGSDVIGIAFDPATGKGWFRDVTLGAAYFGGGDPAAGTSPTFTVAAGTSYYPIASIASSATDSLIANFGQAAYVGAVPSGYGNI